MCSYHPRLHHSITTLLHKLVHSEYEATPGTWIGNPAPLIDYDTSTLWLLMTRNNTDVLAMSSQDWGVTWGAPQLISGQVLAPEWRSKPSWQGGGGHDRCYAVAAHGVVGDVQTPPTPNCASPYAHPLGAESGDGRACSQS